MKIRKRILQDMLIILIMLSPTSLSEMFLPYSSYLFMIMQFCIGFLFFRTYGFLRREKETMLLFSFFFVATLGMLFNYGTSIKGLIRFGCWMVSILGLYVFMTRATDQRIKIFLEASRAMYVLGGILTVVCGLKVTDDMAYGTAVFFWGSEAITVQALIMFFAMSIYYDIRYNERVSKFSIVMGGLSVAFCIYHNSGQGISMFGVMIVLMLLNKVCYERLWKLAKPMIVLIVLTIIYYLVITLRFTEISFVVDYITMVLSKDVSLTGRDAIFKGALEIFSNHPWIGYGYNNAIVNDILGRKFMQFNTAHNSMLQMLIDYGMIGTGLFISLVYCWMTRMYKQIEIAPKMVYFAIIAMFIGGLVNMVVPSNNFWILIILGISSDYPYQNRMDLETS